MNVRGLLVSLMLGVSAASVGCGAAPEAEGEDEANLLPFCTPDTCPPDLTVVEDDRPRWTGSYWAVAQGFRISNIGKSAAPTFHVAVYRNSAYGFDVPGLAVGAQNYYLLDNLGCGEKALVLVNPFNVVKESSYNNDGVQITGGCNL